MTTAMTTTSVTLREAGPVIELLISWVVTTALTFLVVILDERHLSEERLERAWPPTSRDAAIAVFGVLALFVHFIKTRGHLRSARGALGFPLGLALGAIAVVLVAFVSGLLLDGVAALLGL
jgi:hypothetical protein